MTMLDDRARAAVEAIQRTVAEHPIATGTSRSGFAAARRRHALWAGAGWALAGSAAAAAVVGAAIFAPAPEPDVATTITEPTTVTTEAPPTETTVAPAPEPEVSPPPLTEPPVTTEATTTTLAPTTTLDTTAPELAITSPADGAHFEEKVVTFSGTTEPGATVIAGGKWEAAVTAEGHWSINLVLSPGANGAGFRAIDAAGNETTARITVHLDLSEEEPPPKEEPPPGVEFSAFATYGSCELDPPYDVYHGTADPGTTVTITSEYGSGSATANTAGNWEKQVFFPEAPYGVVFAVTVKDHTGKKQVFEFVSWSGGV